MTQQVYEIQGDEVHEDLPVLADTLVEEGDCVSDPSGNGYVQPLDIADTNFAGIALREADNEGGASGDKTVRVRQRGHISIAVVGAAGVGDRGATVYATGPNAFSLTAGANTAIGKVERYVSGTTCIVAFEADSARSI